MMGKEYRIKSKKLDTQATQQFLEQRFTVSVTEDVVFELSQRGAVTEPASDWAPVVVSLEPEGISCSIIWPFHLKQQAFSCS